MAGLKKVASLVFLLMTLAGTTPLLIVAGVGLRRFGMGWHTGLLLVLAALTTYFLLSKGAATDINRCVDDALTYWDEFRHCTFTPVTLQEYVRAVRRFHPGVSNDDDLVRRFVPWAAQRHAKRLRIVVAAAGEDLSRPSPGQAVTFANLFGAWIVLHVPIEEMTEVQYFVLLHEIGHTTFASFAHRGLSTAGMRPMLGAVPFLLMTVAPTATQFGVLALTAACWYGVALREARGHSVLASVSDEVIADIFALKHCDRQWCRRYSARQLARVLCQADTDSATTAPESAAPSRSGAFIDNVGRLRAGETPALPTVLRKTEALPIAETAFAVAVAVLCGLSLAPLTGLRLVLAGGATLFAFASTAMFYLVQTLQGAMLDEIFNIKEMDANQRQFLTRIALQRDQLKRWGLVGRSVPLKTATPVQDENSGGR